MRKKNILWFSLLAIKKESTLIGLFRYIFIKLLKNNLITYPFKKFKNNNKTEGIIIVGCGEYSLSIHLPIIKRLRKSISGITSKNSKNLKHISQIYNLRIYSDLDQILKKSNFDSILISTPPFLHPQNLLDCIDKNVYIYLEKPVAINYEGLKLIQENIISHPNSKKIMVGFNRRYSDSIKKLKSLNLLVNRQKPIEIEYRVNFGKINNNATTNLNIGGGILHSISCHYVDLICYLVNSRVKSICGFNIDDSNNTFTAIFKFQDESIATLIFTSEGDRYFNNKEIINITFDNHNILLSDFEILIIDNKKYNFKGRNYGAFNTMKEFLNCKNNSLDASISINDGVYATQLTLALEKSISFKKIIYFNS